MAGLPRQQNGPGADPRLRPELPEIGHTGLNRKRGQITNQTRGPNGRNSPNVPNSPNGPNAPGLKGRFQKSQVRKHLVTAPQSPQKA